MHYRTLCLLCVRGNQKLILNLYAKMISVSGGMIFSFQMFMHTCKAKSWIQCNMNLVYIYEEEAMMESGGSTKHQVDVTSFSTLFEATLAHSWWTHTWCNNTQCDRQLSWAQLMSSRGRKRSQDTVVFLDESMSFYGTPDISLFLYKLFS